MKISAPHRAHPLFAFSESLSSFPESHALFIKDRFYTYAELAGLAHSIFSLLPEEERYERIAIYCEQDVFAYASILAVGMYGAAYIPLNNKFPAERNKRIIRECQPDLILASGKNSIPAGMAGDTKIVMTDAAVQAIPAEKFCKALEPLREKEENSIFYLLFTSGSTGEPKGVPVSVRNVSAFFAWFRQEYDFKEQDRFLQVYELTFDVSVFSFFMPLMCGACCYVLPEDGIRPLRIIEEIQKHQISVCSMVPSVLSYLERYLPEIRLPSLRYSFFSGDALYHNLAAKWQQCLPSGWIHNFYGPTETTIVCTRYKFTEARSRKEQENGIVPLGKPFPEMSFLILDENDVPAAKGELCFSGPQVISHYLHQREEERFFEYKGRRYYRTGDRAALSAEGNLLFYGRLDDQVKINGYRVELAEVEAAVREASGYRSTAVFIPGEQKLYVFVDSERINVQETMDRLKKLLPLYMMPYKLIPVKEMPLSMNGKVDRPQLLNMYL